MLAYIHAQVMDITSAIGMFCMGYSCGTIFTNSMYHRSFEIRSPTSQIERPRECETLSQAKSHQTYSISLAQAVCCIAKLPLFMHLSAEHLVNRVYR